MLQFHPNTRYNISKAIVKVNSSTLEVLNTYKSLSDAEVAMGKDYTPGMSGHIGDCCKGKRRTAHGYIWQYLDDWKQGIINIKLDYRKAIVQYDLNNNIISEYSSVVEAARHNNLSASSICQCALGKKAKYKNYIWKYKRN